ncbi:MAG: hypothetical protein E6J91_07495 [Deltaproteobacteria bacterium]|nr:MAG: hypothetical protein E6J91_07495 [Deltaproteobacteria bacterium]
MPDARSSRRSGSFFSDIPKQDPETGHRCEHRTVSRPSQQPGLTDAGWSQATRRSPEVCPSSSDPMIGDRKSISRAGDSATAAVAGGVGRRSPVSHRDGGALIRLTAVPPREAARPGVPVGVWG